MWQIKDLPLEVATNESLAGFGTIINSLDEISVQLARVWTFSFKELCTNTNLPLGMTSNQVIKSFKIP